VDLTNPQSLNRYAYVMNNPTTLVDPSGLQGESSQTCGHGFQVPARTESDDVVLQPYGHRRGKRSRRLLYNTTDEFDLINIPDRDGHVGTALGAQRACLFGILLEA
jgi:hypothetical protein